MGLGWILFSITILIQDSALGGCFHLQGEQKAAAHMGFFFLHVLSFFSVHLGHHHCFKWKDGILSLHIRLPTDWRKLSFHLLEALMCRNEHCGKKYPINPLAGLFPPVGS